EHHFDVEQDEQDRHQIELDGEPLVRVTDRRHAALVGRGLVRGDLLRPEHPTQRHHRPADNRCDDDQDEDAEVAGHRSKRVYLRGESGGWRSVATEVEQESEGEQRAANSNRPGYGESGGWRSVATASWLPSPRFACSPTLSLRKGEGISF